MAVHGRPTKRTRRTRVTAESYLLDMRAFPGAKEYPDLGHGTRFPGPEDGVIRTRTSSWRCSTRCAAAVTSRATCCCCSPPSDKDLCSSHLPQLLRPSSPSRSTPVSRVKIGTREEKEALSTSTVAPTSLLSDLVGDLSTDGVSGSSWPKINEEL